MATQVHVESIRRRSAASPIEVPTWKPIKWYAALGCFWLALYTYSTARWLLEGHAKPVGTGPSVVPTHMTVGVWVNNLVIPAFAVVACYYALIKPWRSERRLTTNGVVFLAMCTVWFQDAMPNYFRNLFIFSSASPNIGCPQCFLPGFQNRPGIEPSLWVWFYYFGVTVLLIMGGARMMAWFRARWPQYGRLGPLLFITACSLVFNLVTELFWLRLGLYVYVSAWKPLTLFYGHYYQYPLYACLLNGIWYPVLISARYYTNDKGQIWSDRGVDRLRVGPKQGTALRILAAVGLFNAVLFLGYQLPMALISANSNFAWPTDVQTKSYYTQNICGPGTTYACPDPRIPIPGGPDSGHVTPEGTFIAPKGLPIQVNAP